MIKSIHIIISMAVLIFCDVSCHVKGAQGKTEEHEEESFTPKDHSAEKMSLKEFMGWCADKNNKLSKEKDIEDMRFKLSYLPPEAMAFLELRTEKYDLSKFQKTSKDFSEMSYFNFRIEVIDGTGELLKYKMQSPSQYDARIKYASFEMQNDLYLVQGQDTLLPGLFQFERIFEVAPYATMMFAFDNKKFDKTSEFTIVYNDRLFEKGFVKFNYKNKQLINLPNISEL